MTHTHIAAIPTKYKNVQMRSRLEARWAAFFDLVGWNWDYEPVDLNGYIPDFFLDGRILVEVKPLMWTVPTEPGAITVAQKIDASGWTGPSVLLGARLLDQQDPQYCTIMPRLGLSRRRGTPGDRWSGFYFKSDTVAQGRTYGDAEEIMLAGRHYGFDDGVVYTLWREAGNIVQWRGPRA